MGHPITLILFQTSYSALSAVTGLSRAADKVWISFKDLKGNSRGFPSELRSETGSVEKAKEKTMREEIVREQTVSEVMVIEETVGEKKLRDRRRRVKIQRDKRQRRDSNP